MSEERCPKCGNDKLKINPNHCVNCGEPLRITSPKNDEERDMELYIQSSDTRTIKEKAE